MSAPQTVADASPLIYLAALGRFDLLKICFSKVYVPQAVYEEVVVAGAGQPGAAEVRAASDNGWLQVVSVRNRISVDALLDQLDIGEAEAIVLARELDISRILLDDRMARAKAGLMGLTVTGTIGVLMLAKEAGLVPDLKTDLDALVALGFRISPELYKMLGAP